MQVQSFIKQHRKQWRELEQLLTTLGRSKKGLNGADIQRFDQLYQKTAQHLSFSQTYFPEAEVTGYLNGLVAQSHNLLYKDQVSSFQQIRYFFSTKFIGLFLEQWHFILIAMMLFLLGGGAAFLSVLSDPLHIYSLLPENVAQSVDPNNVGADGAAMGSSTMSAAIMTNNIQVGILAFAGGLTFGILTVYLLISNGIMIGALAGLFWQSGKTYEFWAFIVPHGMIELTAIFIAGGSGLLMGYKLFVPGRYSRVYQLKQQARRSVQLLLGTIPLFVVAGIIEGFITPADLPLQAKYVVAILTVGALALYIASGKLLLRRHSATASLGS